MTSGTPTTKVAPTEPAPEEIRPAQGRPNRRLRSILSLEDFEPAARRHLPRPIFAYVAGATESGVSFAANREDFAKVRFAPRVLAGHTERNQRVTIFGREYAHPFGIAPMGLSALAAYDGDVTLARAANASGIPAMMSATSLTRLERVAEEGSRWFQGYLPGDDDSLMQMVDRVAAAGYETLVVTVDVPTNGNREHNIRNGFSTPMKPTPRLAWQGITHPSWLFGTAFRTLRNHGMPHFENLDVRRGPPIVSRHVERSFKGRERLAWRHIDMIRKRWSGNLVLKGVLAVADAERAREAGADGIVVSNHGGRQLDGALSPMAVLPEIVEVSQPMTVMLDSGVRRGTDVMKALAYGARFVFVGRPFLFAAAIAGEAGVRHGIELLADEVDRTMTLLGIASLEEMDRSLVR
ncbi:alpha-hydroxy acid oxidase [Roseitranquillus sediminis]|uniref:alpha-hydroxy acid oxidase n=1 Tax=Roseitranquillus sediminis TaxID=2809051 RepID=UPI001D0C119C|nr:alpha-hydroxy acid oxidase [Roseitranquillus sediminis]MBM9595416.1 alpha-hydroxy-acid oxidizing protein [Roseitranquillus sediminis]